MKKFSKLLKKLLILLNKLLKFKFTSRNMFGSTGHTVAELDYFFKLVHKYKINKFRIIFLSNNNIMAAEAYKLFSKFFFFSIISDKIDYLLKKYILDESNNLGIDFGLKAWDLAPLGIIVEEAGGTITAVNGDPFDIYEGSILSSNGQFHQELVSLYNRY